MTSEKTDAIVIRQVDFSESSRVVTFFSRDFGKFAALAKGAKRLRGPFDAALDLLSCCRVVFIRKSAGTLNLLTEARLTSRFRPASAELLRVYGGYYVAELLDGLTEDFDVAPSLFDLAVNTLELLCNPTSHPPSILIQFEIQFLREIGLLPNLSACSVCGDEIQLDHKYAHWVSQGGLLCGQCRREEYSGHSVQAGTIQTLRKISECDTGTFVDGQISGSQLIECHRLAVSSIVQAMGRKPSTLRYLQIQ